MAERPLDLDKLAIFLTVVEAGSFSAAARAMGRAQSAVTYAIQELEADLGVTLFDRGGYRPALSAAGCALLPRARLVAEEARALRAQAAGLTRGLEAALTLAIDPMFPLASLAAPLLEFQGRYPSVTTHVHTEALGAAADMVEEGRADLGLVVAGMAIGDALERREAGSIRLIPLCAPGHPLATLQAGLARPLTLQEAGAHLQLVLTDRSPRRHGQDHGVASVQTWRLADLGAKHAMLLAGLGWGSLPEHMARDDVAAGRLVMLRLERWTGAGRLPVLAAALIRRRHAGLGPAGSWLFETLARALGPE